MESDAKNQASPPGKPWAWRSALGLGIILAVGFAVRADRLGDRSYWFDEAFSWKMTTFPWPEMLRRVALDNFPPLFFVLLKPWAILFGNSPLSLRLLSVLFGELTVVGMFLFTREMFRDDRPGDPLGGMSDDRATGMGLLVAALVALSAFQIQWAREVRMYTLGTALAAFSGWLLLRAVRPDDQRLGRWLVYAASALLFAYTHHYALFSLVAQGLFVIGYIAVRNHGSARAAIRDSRAAMALLSFGLLFLGWAPWLPEFLRQRQRVQESFWLPKMSPRLFAVTCYQMFAPSEHAEPSDSVAFLAAELSAAALLLAAWRARMVEWLAILLAIIPFLLSVATSLLNMMIFHTHYFLFAHVYLLAVIAILVGRLRSPLARWAAAVAALLGFAGVYLVFAQGVAEQSNKPGARGAAAFIDRRRGPNEPVVVCSPMLTPIMEGHSQRRAGWRTYKSDDDYPHFQGTAVVQPGEYITAGELADLPVDRVWIVDVERWEKGTISVPVPANWVPGREWRFPEIYGDDCEIIVREFTPNLQTRRRPLDDGKGRAKATGRGHHPSSVAQHRYHPTGARKPI